MKSLTPTLLALWHKGDKPEATVVRRVTTTEIIATDSGIAVIHQQRTQTAITSQQTDHNLRRITSCSSECTYKQTKSSYMDQPFYRCKSCFTGNNEGICAPCANNCHSEHDIDYAGILNGYCDCGLQCCQINCKIGDKCTFDRHGNTGKQQEWYQCYTCWGGESQLGCCKVCAKECHEGHKVVRDGLSQAVCDCGNYRHKSGVCTYHVTGSEKVPQPFYYCSQCFPKPGSDGIGYGCCFQCMKTCHAGHPTLSLGVIKAYCDCGLECCKITCDIPNPWQEHALHTHRMTQMTFDINCVWWNQCYLLVVFCGLTFSVASQPYVFLKLF